MKKRNIIISFIFILLSTFLIFLLLVFFRKYKNKTSFESNILEIANKNTNSIFSIDNITLFSSCNADTSIKTNSNFTLDNLYQYTDIAIFINNKSTLKDLTSENTLKEVYIDNINFSKHPEQGTPELFYKNINSFSKPEFEKDNKIENNLNLGITSEDNIDYNSPTLYNNCANPITLSYINNNIKTNYVLNTTNPITYDGSLLKKCNILLDSITCDISFDIFITNNLDQKYKCPICISIPLEQGSNSIYNGNIKIKDTNTHVFYRYD